MALTLQGGVTKNAISGLGGVGSGALAGASAGPVGAIVGGLAGGIGSLLGNLGNSGSNSAIDLNIKDMYNLEMYNTIKDLYFMNQQDKYNKSNMDYQAKLNAESEERQFNYQKALAQQQFDYNNYFIDNAYQKTVSDLRKAGINPLLATQNGSNVGSVGMGSASALSASLPSSTVSSSSGMSPADFLSASANSANASTNRRQLAINMMNGLTDVLAKTSASAKAIEEAKTQDSIRKMNEAETGLRIVRKEREEIAKGVDEKYLDRQAAANLNETLMRAETGYTNAISQQAIASSAKTTAGATSAVAEEEARIKRARADWITDHPWQYGFQQTLESLGSVGLVGVGAGLSKGHEAFKAHQSKQNKIKNVGSQYMKRSF